MGEAMLEAVALAKFEDFSVEFRIRKEPFEVSVIEVIQQCFSVIGIKPEYGVVTNP